jgi:hypothetical protein
MKNLKSNPFAQYSAEEELDFLNDIFYEPSYYKDLVNLLSKGVSRFLLGQRGEGKSIIIHKIFNDLSQNHTLPLLITRYDSIPLKNNENHLLYKIMQSLTIAIAKQLFKNKTDRKKLSNLQKEKLSFFIELFYSENSSSEFIESAKEIRKIKSKNKWRSFYNRNLIGLLNSLVNGTVNITAQLIKQSIGIDKSDASIAFKDYLRQLPTKDIASYSISEVAAWAREKLLSMLNSLIGVCSTLGYTSIVVLFDKIDEFQAINGDINKVTDFTIEILTDTDLLLSDNLSIVFSLWSEIKRSLNRRGVRFDKFNEIDIRWRKDQLEPLIDQRLLHFSIDKSNPVTFASLVPNIQERNLIIELADKSPRSLIRLLGTIYNRNINKQSSDFSSNAIAEGMIEYCQKFDYESLQPSRLGNQKDLYSWINRLLRIRKTTFVTTDLNIVFEQKLTSSTKHVETLLKLGLIEENLVRGLNEVVQYDIIDPRIKHLISRNILKIDQ